MTQSPATTDSTPPGDDVVPDAGAASTDAPTPDAPAADVGEDGTSSVDDATDAPTDGPTDAQADSATDGDGAPRRTAAQRLEEEGDVAADYLEELLDITDLDGDIDIDVENGRAAVSIVADQTDPATERALKRLVGRDGVVLEALQELTRLAVQAKTGERTRLMLDVAGFRADRRVQLVQVAQTAVATVKESGEPVALDAMSPFERKVVHDAVAEAGLRSESEGEADSRHVVVLPAAEA